MSSAAPAGAAAASGGGSSSVPPQPGHGIYAAIVNEENDLVGHVAYALYKRDKLKFCAEELSRTGSQATQDVLDTFIRGCKLDTRIASYRTEAEILLEQMTEYVLEDTIQEVRREQEEIYGRKLAEGKSWKRAIAENFVGSVVVALVWAVIVLMVAANKVGIDRVMGDVFDKDIVDRPKAKPTPASSGAGG